MDNLESSDLKGIKKVHMPEKKVLVVDDDQDILDVIAGLLELHGYNVYVAKEWNDAMDIMEENRMGAVISDVCMGAMNGFHLMAEIKKHFPGIPVVLMSGVNADETKSLAYSSGADGFIAKPFRIGELINIIDMLF